MENYLSDVIKSLYVIDTEDLNNSLLYQTNDLDSFNYNTTLNGMYRHINHLYDKMRLFESMNTFIEKQTMMHIDTISSECEALLKEIEISRDTLKNASYEQIPVVFVPTASHFDRDGKTLKPTSMIGSVATLYRQPIANASILKGERTTALKPFNDTLKDFPNAPYRTCYFLDKPSEEMLVETIKLFFNNLSDLNMIHLKTADCKIEDIRLTNGSSQVKITNPFFDPAISSDAAILTLSCNHYVVKKYICDLSRMEKSDFDKIAELEYKALISEKSSNQSELDRLLGITQYKEDYEKYLQQVKDWNALKQATINLNQKNGYTSNFPTYDPVLPPDLLGLNASLENKPIETNSNYVQQDIFTSNGERFPTYIENQNAIYPTYEKYRYQSQYYNP